MLVPGIFALTFGPAKTVIFPERGLQSSWPKTLNQAFTGTLASTETESAIGGGTAQAQLAGARGYGCMHGAAASFDLQACAGLTLGVVLGSGRDYAATEDATGTLLAPLVRLGARFPAYGVVALGVALDGFVHLVRPELQVSGRAGGEAAVPPLGAAVSLEAVLAVP